jgi:hypothetical protein
VNGNDAAGARVLRRGTAYVSSVADYNRDGLLDRMVSFGTPAAVAAGLTVGSTNIAVQDMTTAGNRFQATDAVLPTLLP